jgi:hypothetical protein
MSSTALLILALRAILSMPKLVLVACAGLLVANLPILTYLVTEGVPITSISLSGWQKTATVPLDMKVTNSGLIVYVPRIGDQAWDSPLPSTPYFNPALRLIDSGRIASGFTLKGKDGSWSTALHTEPQRDEP